MEQKRVIKLFWCCFLLCSSPYSITESRAHNHEVEASSNQNITVGQNAVISSIPLPTLKCGSESDCNGAELSGLRNGMTLDCDPVAGRCKCPLTFNGLKVLEANASCVLLNSCTRDEDCTLPGSMCQVSNDTGRCVCKHKHMPGDAHAPESCAVPEGPTPWNEMLTLKWIFIFMIIGYPVLTLLFAIFQKERDDHWFFEKFASTFKWNSAEKVKGQRKKQNRRNTQEDLVSTDDDESPLEMEIV